MARIFEDNFTAVTTGTSPVSDTPDTAGAGTWTDIVGGGTCVVDANDRAYHSGGAADNIALRCTDTPSDADYYVEAVLYKHSDIDQDAVGVLARWNDRTGSGGNIYNWYHAGYDDVNGRVALTSVVNGSGTVIGFSTAQTFNATETHTVRLICNGSTISVEWDGTEVISVTNTDHTAAGQAGFYIDHATGVGATAGIHVQSVLAENDIPSDSETIVEGVTGGDIWTTEVISDSHLTWTEGATLAEGFSTLEIFVNDDDGASAGDIWENSILRVQVADAYTHEEGAAAGDEWITSIIAVYTWEEGLEAGDNFSNPLSGAASKSGKLHLRTGTGI